MPLPALDQLTDTQRACLRLVGRGRQTKEIAKTLGLAPNTVDTYLRQALRSLGVATRFEAARLLEQWEEHPSQDLRYQPQAIAGGTEAAMQGTPEGDATPPPNVVQERHPPFDPRVGPGSDRESHRFFGLGGGPNALTTRQRLIWMVIGTVLILLALFLGLAAFESFQRTLLDLSGTH